VKNGVHRHSSIFLNRWSRPFAIFHDLDGLKERSIIQPEIFLHMDKNDKNMDTSLLGCSIDLGLHRGCDTHRIAPGLDLWFLQSPLRQTVLCLSKIVAREFVWLAGNDFEPRFTERYDGR
jgi:hypothetical protein